MGPVSDDVNDIKRGAASGSPSRAHTVAGEPEAAPPDAAGAADETRAMQPGAATTAAGLERAHKRKSGLTRLQHAVLYSLAGLRAAFRHEDAFRLELLALTLLTPTAFVLERSGIGRALMIGSMLLVLVVELLNSAIEAAVDRISFEDHQLAKRAKDMGSAAVFVSLINVAVVWGCVLL